jgi:lipid A 4'-phosphatase
MCPGESSSQFLISSPQVRGVAIIVALFAFGMGSTAVLDYYGWDLAWSASFYTATGSGGVWAGAREQPWRFLYDYGEIPGILLLFAGIGGYVASRAGKIQRRYAAPCLVVVLTVVLGPGILVNGMLKNYWGRPRPADTSILGGQWEYRRVSEPGIPGRGKSFPCGHCSMAFALASGAAFFPFHATLAGTALAGGIVYGVVMGKARVAQGGHFPSDVIWSGVLVLAIVAALYYLVFRIPETARDRAPSRLQRSRGRALLVAAFVVLPCLLFLCQSPFYEEVRIPVQVPSGVGRIVLEVNPPWAAGEMLSAPTVARHDVRVITRGLGTPWARITHRLTTKREAAALHVHCDMQPVGHFWEWWAQATLEVPAEKP